MPQVFRSTTRWAIYLRDELSCTYCGVTMVELVKTRGSNFLTLDHLQTRKAGGNNEASNLVTCCLVCNTSRGSRTLVEFSEALGFHRVRLWNRARRRTRRPLEQFREAARLMLGEVEGVPPAQLAIEHDFLVRSNRSPNDLDVEHWKHLRAAEGLFCMYCDRPQAFDSVLSVAVSLPPSDDDVPF